MKAYGRLKRTCCPFCAVHTSLLSQLTKLIWAYQAVNRKFYPKLLEGRYFLKRKLYFQAVRLYVTTTDLVTL